MADFAFLDHPGPIPFAHRGGASAAPENTMAAFEVAVELGYRYVETDVHTTADGVVVAFHDDVLDRVTDREGRIEDLPWTEVRRARVAGTEPIPRLDELLGAWPDLRINIDPKADRSVDPLIDVLRRSGAVERVCIGAFSDERIDRIRAAFDGRICTSTGPDQVVDLWAVMEGQRRTFRAACVQIMGWDDRGRLVCSPELIRAAHDHGMLVHAWTIDDPDEMRTLLDYGVDGIMTDEPAVLRAVFEERGLWV